MDALLALFAQLWWVAPAGAAGAAGVAVVRGRGRSRMRRLELDAAHADVRSARTAVARSRTGVQVARADLARAEAARYASAGGAAAAAARRSLADAQHAARVALADLVARRAEVRAARAALPARHAAPTDLPLARLTAQHDAVMTAWLAYETDPALSIAYPAMTDARSPYTAAFLDALDQARWLRPRATTGRGRAARVSAGEFSAYRDAVRRMQRAFAEAEHDARRLAGDTRVGPSGGWVGGAWAGGAWQGVAHDVVDGVARVIAWSETRIGRPGSSRPRTDRTDHADRAQRPGRPA